MYFDHRSRGRFFVARRRCWCQIAQLFDQPCGGVMSSNVSEIVSRLQMLGLKCDNVPLDKVSSPIAALACFPMYMVANVHGWTSDRQFKIPLLDIQGLEAFREAFVIGEEEGRLQMTPEHRKVVDSMLSTARPPDRVVYEYALATLKQYLAIAGRPQS